jgi:hypothetical protein
MPHFRPPDPPRLWHRGGTPVPDALPRAPDARFAKNTKNVFSQNTDDGDRKSPMTFFYILIRFDLKFNLYIRDFRFWRIAPRRQHIRTSAEVGSHK